MAGENLVAIGRSRYLYNAIIHLHAAGFVFKAIFTEEAYDEYDIKHTDFEALAQSVGARFYLTRDLYTDEVCELIEKNHIRVAISANWKYTIPQKFLNLFECGILNFHLGNLPDYKGNATVNWTIINGEPFINGNIHKMDPQLDAGDIITRKKIAITADLYIQDILKKAEAMAPKLYEVALKKVFTNPNAYEVQGSVHGLRCYPRLPEDNQIDWNETALTCYNLVRASAHPYKGAFSFLNNEKVIIWKAEIQISEDAFLAMPGHVIAIEKKTGSILVACKSGILRIAEIEINGLKMPATDWVKSIRVRFKFKYDV